MNFNIMLIINLYLYWTLKDSKKKKILSYGFSKFINLLH